MFDVFVEQQTQKAELNLPASFFSEDHNPTGSSTKFQVGCCNFRDSINVLFPAPILPSIEIRIGLHVDNPLTDKADFTTKKNVLPSFIAEFLF